MYIQNKKRLAIIALWLLAFLIAIFLPPHNKNAEGVSSTSMSVVLAPMETLTVGITERQNVWLYALEWCESRGVHTAINQVDRDGTPSYYSFQFKPGTFRGYGERYGVIPKGLSNEEIMEKMKSYALQREIVINMIPDTSIKWATEFPDCVKKLGYPPKG